MTSPGSRLSRRCPDLSDDLELDCQLGSDLLAVGKAPSACYMSYQELPCLRGLWVSKKPVQNTGLLGYSCKLLRGRSTCAASCQLIMTGQIQREPIFENEAKQFQSSGFTIRGARGDDPVDFGGGKPRGESPVMSC